MSMHLLFLLLPLLLRYQGPRHTPQMHHSLEAYCATLGPPPDLDVPASADRRTPMSTQRERPLVAKGGTLWARNVW